MINMKSVLITGASTGIGRASALRLDREGFQVFAGVRKPGDGEELKKASTGGLIPVMLDVTDAESIATAVKTVSEKTNGGLSGLMNNAGLTGGGPVEMVPISKIRSIIEVNLISIFAVTQAFLPMLRKSKGRIINTGSIFGLISPPGRSIYSATKFALEAISNSLRLELLPFGITVSVLEPGAISTEIWRKASANTDELIEQSQPDIYELYKPLFQFYKKRFAEQINLPPEAVADCVYHAFTSRKPKRHYVVGNDAKFLLWIKRLPDSIRDWFVYKTVYK